MGVKEVELFGLQQHILLHLTKRKFLLMVNGENLMKVIILRKDLEVEQVALFRSLHKI